MLTATVVTIEAQSPVELEQLLERLRREGRRILRVKREQRPGLYALIDAERKEETPCR